MTAEERALMLNLMIKQLRKSQGMTQQQLAERLGCTQREVWRYEKPGYKVPPKVIYELSIIFGCPIDHLFGVTQRIEMWRAFEELNKLKVSDTWV